MAGYTETYRDDVCPWEVDSTEHFTVAYYYEKFESATWRFLKKLGVDATRAITSAAVTHYKSELRNRDIYFIETALISNAKNPVI